MADGSSPHHYHHRQYHGFSFATTINASSKRALLPHPFIISVIIIVIVIIPFTTVASTS